MATSHSDYGLRSLPDGLRSRAQPWASYFSSSSTPLSPPGNGHQIPLSNEASSNSNNNNNNGHSNSVGAVKDLRSGIMQHLHKMGGSPLHQVNEDKKGAVNSSSSASGDNDSVSQKGVSLAL